MIGHQHSPRHITSDVVHDYSVTSTMLLASTTMLILLLIFFSISPFLRGFFILFIYISFILLIFLYDHAIVRD